MSDDKGLYMSPEEEVLLLRKELETQGAKLSEVVELNQCWSAEETRLRDIIIDGQLRENKNASALGELERYRSAHGSVEQLMAIVKQAERWVSVAHVAIEEAKELLDRP